MFNKKSKNPLQCEHAHTLIHRYCTLRQEPLLHIDDVTGNLRIAAGSIMPRITTGNTMAPCVVIGGSAAEILRQIPKCRPVFANLSISLGRITPDAVLCRDLDKWPVAAAGNEQTAEGENRPKGRARIKLGSSISG
jgi:hypothetical protein